MTPEVIGKLAVPIVLSVCAFLLLIFKKDLTDDFFEGAKQGVTVCFNLLPTLVLLMCAVRMLFASGAIELISNVAHKPLSLLGIAPELSSVLLVRPFSGSAATAVADSIFKTYGPDSDVGLFASVVMGASDTIIYTLSMYFSAAQIKKTRYAITASFLVFIFCFVVGGIITRKMLV